MFLNKLIRYDQSSRFPANLLPVVKKPGELLDCKENRVNLSIRDNLNNQYSVNNANVHVALGDLQCAIYSCLENEYDCGNI